MFEYPYLFWTVAISFAIPVLGLFVCGVWIARSQNPKPLSIALAIYGGIHLIGLFISSAVLELDGDWVKYRSYGSLLWKIAYYGPGVLSIFGLAVMIIVSQRKTARQRSRGFDVRT